MPRERRRAAPFERRSLGCRQVRALSNPRPAVPSRPPHSRAAAGTRRSATRRPAPERWRWCVAALAGSWAKLSAYSNEPKSRHGEPMRPLLGGIARNLRGPILATTLCETASGGRYDKADGGRGGADL